MSDHRHTILLAEDDPSIRELVRTQLKFAGYDVHLAKTGTEALVQIGSLSPDAVILDINMPELDGFGVLKRLAANTAGTRPPVLILTARNDVEDVKLALRLGAKDYLAKPFTQGQLLARVVRLLRKAPAFPAGNTGDRHFV